MREFSRILLFFTVLYFAVAFSLVHFFNFIFLERHCYQCCLLIILIIFEEREREKERQTENSYSNTKTFSSKDCIPC